ncbi:MAG: hypothetical protein AAF940_02625 [Pseudomonadota bacterium]
MARSRRWQIIRAYLAGCLVATLIVTVRLLIKAPDALAIVTALLLIGMVASIVMTFLPFLILAFLSETRSIRALIYYLTCGLALAIIAAFASYGPQTVAVMRVDPVTIIAFAIAGAAGGFTYWRLAGSTAGSKQASAGGLSG